MTMEYNGIYKTSTMWRYLGLYRNVAPNKRGLEAKMMIIFLCVESEFQKPFPTVKRS
jgi:hypothetical protein